MYHRSQTPQDRSQHTWLCPAFGKCNASRRPPPKYPELTAPQTQQSCELKDCHGIRRHGQEAHIRLWKVSICGQCHPLSPFVLTGAWASCLLAHVLLQDRAAGGLCSSHSSSSNQRCYGSCKSGRPSMLLLVVAGRG